MGPKTALEFRRSSGGLSGKVHFKQEQVNGTSGEQFNQNERLTLTDQKTSPAS
jgi:hypothetical protein